jgi:DNA-binding transcriptional regulator YiaG
MSKKKELVYKGLGFPVILKNVETVEFRGEILPKINHAELEKKVFEILTSQKQKLTGSQLQFIRGFMKKSQKEFSKELGFNSHATVSAWEKTQDKPTGMLPPVELAVRMLMSDYLCDPELITDSFKEILSGLKEPEGYIKVAA